ncbi:MAG TPA: hypothetical protein VNM87_14420, partial [Candidatus Udaeobacter sp.]|nr:hypothetical protein [Candidatus Udaeobacter sp.]
AIAAAVSERSGHLTVADLGAALADTARPPRERTAHARALVLADDGGLDAALDAVRRLGETPPVAELRSGLARRGTAVLLRLGVRPDGEALAQDPALGELWSELAFHPELAGEAAALLGAQRGELSRLLRRHLAGHERELWDYLLARLAARGDGDEERGNHVLDVLLELGEHA